MRSINNASSSVLSLIPRKTSSGLRSDYCHWTCISQIDNGYKGNKHNRGHKGDAGIELETRSQVRSSRPRFSLRLVSGRLLLGTLPLFDMQPTQPCQLKKSSPSQLRAAAVATPICCLQFQQPGPQLRLLPASRLLHLAKGAVVTADSGFSDL
ncbi:hypothetical protein B296_00025848 [Ensete ventricosum]|uniref:Uncharacterized protein n=1 Tax=Ensete ventricosum TaxID=4639 RepID=A0A426YDA1_ENSVE|nr:hypothetical protein B296_00025848 [Ensete ventricosum]